RTAPNRDFLDSAGDTRRAHAHSVPRFHGTSRDSPGKSAERVIWSVHPLHRHYEWLGESLVLRRSALKPLQKCRSVVPGHHRLRWMNYVLSFKRRERNSRDRSETEIFGEVSVRQVDFSEN